MLKNILKVFGEDLINAEINKSSVSGSEAVAAGSTQGALAVNVFAKGAVKVGATALVVTVKDGDTENGSFTEVGKITVSQGDYADGDLMGTMTLPASVKAYVTADATSATTNSGSVRVTLGYLAR